MQKNQINAFYSCVKENYNLIIGLLTLNESQRALEDNTFRHLLFSLRDTFNELETIHGVVTFTSDTKDYEFFNMMVEQSRNLSDVAKRVGNGTLEIKALYEEINNYCKYSADFQVKYALILK